MASTSRAMELVRLITTPNDTSRVHEASEELQRLQLSGEGWQIADTMLRSNDLNVRFYGALTLQIKLNKEGAFLSEQGAEELKTRIVSWFIQSTLRQERRLVLDKLCSTLTTFFIQSPTSWAAAVRQIICSLQAQDVVPTYALDGYPETWHVISRFDHCKKLAALRICRALAEDLNNEVITSSRFDLLDSNLKSNLVPAAQLMNICLVPSEPAADTGLSTGSIDTSSDAADITVEAIHCFNAWVTYAYKNWSSDPEALQHLQDLTMVAANSILSPQETLRDATLELFVGILEYRPRFLEKAHREMISILVRSNIGPQCVIACQEGNDDASVLSVCKLVSAYGKTAIKDVIARRGAPSSAEIIELFQQLLTGPGYPAEDDEYIIYATEFWTDYAEEVVDTIVDSDGEALPTWLPQIREDLMKAIQSYIKRLQLPRPETYRAWDDDVFESWKSFRDNVADLLQSITNIPDTYMLNHLVLLFTHVLPSKDWAGVEATLFCINAIAESINIEDCQEALNTLMGSSIFNDISADGNGVPVFIKRAVLRMIDGYSDFIKKNPAHIPPVLNFLFTILGSTSPLQAKTADQAAKSFETLCSSCRKALTPHLTELLQQCPRALSGPAANAYQKEKIMASLASIIQALPSDEAKAEPLSALIANVESDLNAAVQALQSGNTELGETLGTTALQCLASIGKGIQAPDDLPIDIDSDNDDDDNNNNNNNSSNNASQSAFWISTPTGQSIQSRILATFQLLDFLPQTSPAYGDAVEAATSVLIAGLTEPIPGPFVFGASSTSAFISKLGHLSTPRIETILSLSSTFVSAFSRNTSPHASGDVLAIYSTLGRLISDLGVSTPESDPAVSQLVVEVLQRLLNKYLDVFLSPPDADIASVLTFLLASLDSHSPMLKRAACSFFEALIPLSRPRLGVAAAAAGTGAAGAQHEQPTRIPISDVLAHFLPQIVNVLVGQIGGKAQRSELDHLCKPLRAFVSATPNAKQVLENAVAGLPVLAPAPASASAAGSGRGAGVETRGPGSASATNASQTRSASGDAMDEAMKATAGPAHPTSAAYIDNPFSVDDDEEDDEEQGGAQAQAAKAREAAEKQTKRVFVAKVLACRGNKQTNVVVREFWALCKGTVSSFA